MTITQQPPSSPSRSSYAEDLRRGIIHTTVSPTVARLMVWTFLAFIFGLPIAQAALELSRGERPKVLNLLALFRPAPPYVPTQQQLKTFEEEDLANASFAKRPIQSRLQYLTTAFGGFGNEKGVLGLDGWLFYQPGLDYVAGPPLLEPGRLRAKTKKMIDAGESDWHPDPRPAILQFHRDCAAAGGGGVKLILVPIPDKVMLQPAQLTRRLRFAEPVATPNNPDYAKLIADLKAAGVDVFDPTPEKLSPADPPRFLTQDTHWTPEWMEQVAKALADHIRAVAGKDLDPATRPFTITEEKATRVGDLVDMLKLPDHQNLYPPQTLTLHKVLTPDATAWQPVESAQILLLGDSFTNIYTAKEMGWGQSAGLGPQLSRYLARDLDVIAHNGSGASMTRAELARRPHPFAGKKIILWQFAMRDLYSGNWLTIPIEAQPTAATQSATDLVVVAELLAAPPRINPAETPYTDANVILKFRIRSLEFGTLAGKEFLARMPLMQDRKLLPAARYRPGSAFRLTLTPRIPNTTTMLLDNVGDTNLPQFWTTAIEPRK